ncbi:MAG TPA: glycosyltransferase [Miltoncostaeaceae bacterium]|nr:glycosyltransferase [Miltoncostaeaceae bacterium]
MTAGDAEAERVALLARAGSGLAALLREAAWRGIAATVAADEGDARARALAAAAGAEVAGVWPGGREAATLVVDRLPADLAELPPEPVLVAPAAAADALAAAGRRVVPIVSVIGLDPSAARARAAELRSRHGAVVLAGWDPGMLDALTRAGVVPGPVREPPAPPGARLDGVRALHLTSVHRPDDGRIFHREVAALRAAGADARVLGLAARPPRSRRAAAGRRLVEEARRREVDVYHVHDPELLPGAVWLRRATGRVVIYDAHEYLGQTTRTKPWIPGPFRTPTAVGAAHAERALARRLSGVVAVTEDLAVEFAATGVPAVSVANYAAAERFPDPGPADGPVVAYVGALDASRGLGLMLEAFPMVAAPGARLVLAGPGDPGPLPPPVTHLGPVPYDVVPRVLAGAAVVWIPLRRTPNNDRGRLTKVMEAMAAGRPLVASDLTRTATIVRAAGCGIVVPDRDPAAHAAALTRLLEDPETAARMGAAGRRAFLERMTFGREAARLVAFYAELLGR